MRPHHRVHSHCGYQSFSNAVSLEDTLVCFGGIQQIHWKVLQSWYNPRTLISGPSIDRILEKSLEGWINFRTSPIPTSFHSCPLMPSVWGITLSFVPGLGVQWYHKCAMAMFELLPRLLPTSNSEICAKLSSACVESKNGYDLSWHVLELTVPAFDPTVPLK